MNYSNIEIVNGSMISYDNKCGETQNVKYINVLPANFCHFNLKKQKCSNTWAVDRSIYESHTVFLNTHTIILFILIDAFSNCIRNPENGLLLSTVYRFVLKTLVA